MDLGNPSFDGEPLASTQSNVLAGITSHSLVTSPYGQFTQSVTPSLPVVQQLIDPSISASMNILPNADVSDVVLSINSIAEATQYVVNNRPRKVKILDVSYPWTPEGQLLWVKAIFKAFMEKDHAIDGTKMMQQWNSIISDNKINLELVAWKFLRLVMLYHNFEGKLEPSNRETVNFKVWDNFAEHMNYMLGALTVKKTLCRHLVTDIWTAAFIDAPELHSLRVDNNRKINEAKKAKVLAGIAALKHVGDTVEGKKYADSEEETQLRALLSTVPIVRARTQRQASSTPANTPRAQTPGVVASAKRQAKVTKLPKGKKRTRINKSRAPSIKIEDATEESSSVVEAMSSTAASPSATVFRSHKQLLPQQAYNGQIIHTDPTSSAKQTWHNNGATAFSSPHSQHRMYRHRQDHSYAIVPEDYQQHVGGVHSYDYLSGYDSQRSGPASMYGIWSPPETFNTPAAPKFSYQPINYMSSGHSYNGADKHVLFPNEQNHRHLPQLQVTNNPEHYGEESPLSSLGSTTFSTPKASPIQGTGITGGSSGQHHNSSFIQFPMSPTSMTEHNIDPRLLSRR